jgi:hypothetical protein
MNFSKGRAPGRRGGNLRDRLHVPDAAVAAAGLEPRELRARARRPQPEPAGKEFK